MPEWHLMIATLGVVSLIGLAWTPLLIAVPLFLLALAAPAVQAWTSTENLSPDGAHSGRGRARTRITVAALHLLQPLARLRGRLKYGLTVWRKRGPDGLSWPVPRTLPILVTQWQPPEARLAALAEALQNTGAVVLHGNRYDSWDLEVRGGLFGSSRMLMAFEDSGSGTQLVRLRAWPYCSPLSLVPIAFFLSFAALAAFNGATVAGVLLRIFGAVLAGRAAVDCGLTMHAVMAATAASGPSTQSEGPSPPIAKPSRTDTPVPTMAPAVENSALPLSARQVSLDAIVPRPQALRMTTVREKGEQRSENAG